MVNSMTLTGIIIFYTVFYLFVTLLNFGMIIGYWNGLRQQIADQNPENYKFFQDTGRESRFIFNEKVFLLKYGVWFLFSTLCLVWATECTKYGFDWKLRPAKVDLVKPQPDDKVYSLSEFEELILDYLMTDYDGIGYYSVNGLMSKRHQIEIDNGQGLYNIPKWATDVVWYNK